MGGKHGIVLNPQNHGFLSTAQGTFATAEGRPNGFPARNFDGRLPPRDPPPGRYVGGDIVGLLWGDMFVG